MTRQGDNNTVALESGADIRNNQQAIRPAIAADLPALVAIYNHYVTSSHCTFDTEPFSVESRSSWWSQFDGGRYQCWVAESEEAILGYACTGPLKAKAAYGTSVEISVYVGPNSAGRGIGQKLYDLLLPRLAEQDLHRVYALIALPNEPSIRLHQHCGFSKVAQLTEVGRKFDRYWDVAWYERPL